MWEISAQTDKEEQIVEEQPGDGENDKHLTVTQ